MSNSLLRKIRGLRGLRDFHSQDHKKFYPWGFAMNGMTSRLEATRQIIFGVGIERIVETGTFRGTTTEWFAQFGLPVETVEITPRHHAFSVARLAGYKNVDVILNSSVSFLKDRIAQKRVAPDTAQLFYLDSHWKDNFPLREELQLIFNCYTNAVVLIDDFEVADDSGYAYDNYGPDKAATLSYVKSSNLPALEVFYPATPAKKETGARCGWVVFCSNAVTSQKLSQISLLRKYISSKA